MRFPVDDSTPPRSGRAISQPPEPGKKSEEDVEVKERVKEVVPRRYRVLFHNDDYTTMEFVVDTLITFFHKSETEATHIMLTVHKMGSAVAGIFTRDVAETKVEQVMDHARGHGMPLLLTAEPE